MNKLDTFKELAELLDCILSRLQGSGAARLQDFEDTTNEDQTAPGTPKLHSFEEVLKALENGKRVRRKNSQQFAFGLGNMGINPIVHWADILANDWLIYEDN